MIDNKGSTRHSASPVAKIAKNFGGVTKMPAPPPPTKNRFSYSQEASFTNIYGTNAADLRTADGISLNQHSHTNVFSPSRRALLNLPPEKIDLQDEEQETPATVNVPHANRFQKIYFGSEHSTDIRKQKGNVQNRISEFQDNRRSIKEKFLGNRDPIPQERSPTLGELLNQPSNPLLGFSNCHVQNEPLLRHKIARNPNSVNFSNKNDCVNIHSIDADSLQDPEESRQSSLRHSVSPVHNSLGRPKIQDMPLPEIPVKSGLKPSNRTLINLRNKQPVKEAVRNIENHSSRSGTPEEDEQLSPSKFDVIKDLKPTSDFFHEQCQSQKLIKSEPKQPYTKVGAHNRKRLAPKIENSGKHRKRNTKGGSAVFQRARLIAIINSLTKGLYKNTCSN